MEYKLYRYLQAFEDRNKHFAGFVSSKVFVKPLELIKDDRGKKTYVMLYVQDVKNKKQARKNLTSRCK